MRFPTPMARALCTAAAIAFLAACSNGGAQSSIVKAPGIGQQAVHHYVTPLSPIPKGYSRVRNPHLNFVGPDTFVKGGVYAGQFTTSNVNLYGLPNKNNKAARCADNGVSSVNGLNVGPHRMLYVPNGGTAQILTFGANCGASGTTYSDPNGQPADVAFWATTIYVADASTGAVDVYANGATSPTSTLSNPAISGGNFGVAYDSGNVFASTNAGVIVEYTGASEPGTALSLTGVAAPVGMAFDNAHNLIVIDLFDGILVYAPPYNGSPIASTATVGGSVYGHVNAANTALYVGDYVNGTVDVYSYPGLTYEYSISNGLSNQTDVEGVAVDSQGHQK